MYRAFLAAGLAGGRRVWRRPAAYTLLLPTLWMMLVWLNRFEESGVPVWATSRQNRIHATS